MVVPSRSSRGLLGKPERLALGRGTVPSHFRKCRRSLYGGESRLFPQSRETGIEGRTRFRGHANCPGYQLFSPGVGQKEQPRLGTEERSAKDNSGMDVQAESKKTGKIFFFSNDKDLMDNGQVYVDDTLIGILKEIANTGYVLEVGAHKYEVIIRGKSVAEASFNMEENTEDIIEITL